MLLIVVLAIVGALVGSDKKKSTTAKPSGGSSAETTGPSVSYPGKEHDDHVATAAGEVQLSGFTVTAPAWEKSQEFGENVICGTVSLLNRDSKAQAYNLFDWRLQSPAGDVQDPTFTTTNSLGSGDLVSKGTKQGRVCFKDPALPGQYIAIWKPDAFIAAWGIWLFNL